MLKPLLLRDIFLHRVGILEPGQAEGLSPLCFTGEETQGLDCGRGLPREW